MTKNVIISILFSVTLLIGIMVCLICNITISGNFTWSLIPVSSIVFAWVISFPSIILGKRGGVVSLISLIVFLWIIVATFNRIGKTRKLIALGITFLLAISFVIIVNVMLSKMIEEPIFDVWDMLSIFILLIFAFASFIYDYAKKGIDKVIKMILVLPGFVVS